MNEEFEAIISGRVQLVMYRDFVQRNAKTFGITGTVQNMKNGTVCVVAQGTHEKLEEFLKCFHKGPLLADVKEVSVTWRTPATIFKRFSIVY